MSASKKQLQMRFSKMRSNTGRKAKIMSLVMAVALLVTTVCATVVMAAVGSDGLEHWDKNEIYYRDGMVFSINVSNKNVPDYVMNDIAGTNGNIEVMLSRYQARNMQGIVTDEYIVQMTGTNGKIKMSSNGYSSLTETNDVYTYGIDEIKNYKYETELTFIEWYGVGWVGHDKEPVAQLVDKPTDKGKRINLIFGLDENKRIQNVFVKFEKADKDDNPLDEKFDFAKSNDGSISYIKNFEKDYISDCGYGNTDKSNIYFTVYEDDFKNIKNENIDISILSASSDGIKVKTDIKIPEAYRIAINVYNKNGNKIAFNERNEAIKSEYLLTPETFKQYEIGNDGEANLINEEDVPENQINSGERYRVCAVIFDKDYKIVYRFLDYVTAQ